MFAHGAVVSTTAVGALTTGATMSLPGLPGLPGLPAFPALPDRNLRATPMATASTSAAATPMITPFGNGRAPIAPDFGGRSWAGWGCAAGKAIVAPDSAAADGFSARGDKVGEGTAAGGDITIVR